MNDLRISRRHALAGVAAMSLVGVLSSPAIVFADDKDDEGKGRIARWDIVSVGPSGISAGGHASAIAQDGSMITMTGSGTFRTGHAQPVTGGGNWTATGAVSGNGTYKVTGLVSFVKAPGTLPPVPDNIGDRANAAAGLVFLNIAYSNGMQGVLTVSCHLVGTPNTVFEGIRTSMGFVDFWNGTAPVDGVNANRTLFHVMHAKDEED